MKVPVWAWILVGVVLSGGGAVAQLKAPTNKAGVKSAEKAVDRPLTQEEKDAAAAVGAAGVGFLGLGLLSSACVGLVLLLFYFVPAFIAGMRGHQNTAAIAILNIMLGWTFLGWVAALVWAFTAVERPDYRRHR